MSNLTPKERMKIPRQEMPAQNKVVRRGNFNEVALGFTDEQARLEAERCIQCPKPACIAGCPVGVKIPQFIDAVRKGDMPGAVNVMKETNLLPAICGRVCPQETQCEELCVLGKKGQPVAVGRLERYVGDYELEKKTTPIVREPATGKKVAVVGTGPSSLTCAVDVARRGHHVVMFESLHAPGGVLTYGIPEFRLPKKIVFDEIGEGVQNLGIEIRTDHIIGRTRTIDDLLAEFDAVFIGSGAGLPSFPKIPGTQFNGVFSANEYLTRVNLMKGYLFPEFDTPVKVGKKVAVVGAGNVAMDAARSALRLQALRNSGNGSSAGEVHIIYRRSRAEVPARAEEVEHAEEEGIVFDFLTDPVEIYGDEKGCVRGVRLIKMELGEPDASGRRRPVPVKGSEFELPLDMIIFALGTSPNPLVFIDAGTLERSKWGTVVADSKTGRTTKDRVWAGGDVVTGAATVVSAMGAGRAAAADMHEFLLKGGSWKTG